MANLKAIEDIAAGIYGIDTQPTGIHLHLQEVMDAVAVDGEPVAIYFVQPSPSPTCDVINHASILGCRADTIENGAGPLVVVIVSVKDAVHAIGFKEWDQLRLHPARAAVVAGAESGMMEENELPGLCASLQVTH